MKVRHAPRSERRLVFDPVRIEAETEFVCDWEERDPESEDIDAREAASAEFGHRALDD